MPGVIVREKEPFEKTLRRFKKACEKAGIMSDIRRHQYYEKPSEQRKRKENSARRKMLKLSRQEEHDTDKGKHRSR
ncbi:MAG: 30S ribosomal protein S21 [Candidatus Latescibacteria bacterium]|jgi:small subunit ribosomal protein S21|nr:30S ribosomal protein S21 [Candidatus Latescibacterota bacterium]